MDIFLGVLVIFKDCSGIFGHFGWMVQGCLVIQDGFFGVLVILDGWFRDFGLFGIDFWDFGRYGWILWDF